MSELPKSAIIVIESPKGYWFEGRPNIPSIAYAGMIALFGGMGIPGEDPKDTIFRELTEEISADPGGMNIKPLWKPSVRLAPLNGGRPRRVEVHTFIGRVSEDVVEARETGHEAILFERSTFLNGSKPQRMTDFAYGITKYVVLGRRPHIWH